MNRAKVYLGLGSNLGDRVDNISRALELLDGNIDIGLTSSVYETEPWGYTAQPRFLNCVSEGFTSLQPAALLRAVKDAEVAVGRRPTFPGGPRVVDVDILFYGKCALTEPDLEIPHPRMAERAFVLVPLSEIAPDLVHPILERTVEELVRALGSSTGADQGQLDGVRLWGPPIFHRSRARTSADNGPLDNSNTGSGAALGGPR